MPAHAPKPNETLPIDDDDHTVEADMQWLLAERPELKTQIGSADANRDYDVSTNYEDPKIGTTLTATQVIDLLNLGK